MMIFVFGNQDLAADNQAIEFAQSEKIEGVEFIFIKPNQDLPFENEDLVVMMDVIEGLKEVKVFDENDIDRLILPPRTSAHDFDLGFQLKYLKKLGKLKEIKLIGLPMTEKFDFGSVRSIILGLV